MPGLKAHNLSIVSTHYSALVIMLSLYCALHETGFRCLLYQHFMELPIACVDLANYFIEDKLIFIVALTESREGNFFLVIHTHQLKNAKKIQTRRTTILVIF